MFRMESVKVWKGKVPLREYENPSFKINFLLKVNLIFILLFLFFILFINRVLPLTLDIKEIYALYREINKYCNKNDLIFNKKFIFKILNKTFF